MMSEKEICAICQEEMFVCVETYLILKCRHKYHTTCISQINSFDCPLCRCTIENDDVPKEIYNAISNNVNNRLDELRREDTSSALSAQLHEIRTNYASIEFEINVVVSYFKDVLKIPLKYLPSKIFVYPPLFLRYASQRHLVPRGWYGLTTFIMIYDNIQSIVNNSKESSEEDIADENEEIKQSIDIIVFF